MFKADKAAEREIFCVTVFGCVDLIIYENQVLSFDHVALCEKEIRIIGAHAPICR